MKTSMILIISLLVIGCATQKQQAKQNPAFIEIKFGSGGGFTGAQSQYLLKNNGEVYKAIDDSIVLINKITGSKTDSIFNIIQKISFRDIEFNEFGNMTYQIEVSTADYKKRVNWTDQSQTPELKELYKTLVQTLKK